MIFIIEGVLCKVCQNAGCYSSVILSEDVTLNTGITKHSVLRTGTSILSPEWPLSYQYFRGFLKPCFLKECVFYLLILFVFTYVYWTVHHLYSCVKRKNQLDATYFII